MQKKFPLGQGHNKTTCGKKQKETQPVNAKFRQPPQPKKEITAKKPSGIQTATDAKPVGEEIFPSTSLTDLEKISHFTQRRKEATPKLEGFRVFQLNSHTSIVVNPSPDGQLLLRDLAHNKIINCDFEKYDCVQINSHTVAWFNNEGLLHRIGAPAIEYAYGGEEWWENGKRHRLDGPAEIFEDDGILTYCWYGNGVLHREGQPAKVVVNLNDSHHRGSTTVPFISSEEWWVRGKGHRVGAPAIESADGHKEWLVNGRHHRIGAPAVQYKDGGEEWWVRGKQHRIGEPAVTFIDNDGDVIYEWWVNNKRHRLDGPAVTFGDWGEEWWVNGVKSEFSTMCRRALQNGLSRNDVFSLSTHSDYVVRQLVLQNPQILPEWKVVNEIVNK